MRKNHPSPAQRQAIALIQKSSSIYLGAHIRPDGDAIGSVLGLALALEAEGHRVARLCAYPVQESYRFLSGVELFRSSPPDWTAGLGIVIDCDGISRLGELEPVFSALPHLIDIDHHSGNNAFGEVRLVDPTAAAAALITYRLLEAAGFPITPAIATCFYTSLLDDTGRFAHPNTTADALSVAAELVTRGAEPAPISKKLFFEQSVNALRLLGRALSGITLHHDGQVVTSIIHLSDIAAVDAQPSDTEGVIDYLRSIRGPQVAALFTELEGGQVRVSLRSDGLPQVNRIAALFGGGGHPGAAGCTIAGRPEAARDQALAVVYQALP
jgi:phosphoesterase RecJ-like protein